MTAVSPILRRLRNLLAILVVIAAALKGAHTLDDMGRYSRKNDLRALEISPDISRLREQAEAVESLTLMTGVEGQPRAMLALAVQYEITPTRLVCLSSWDLREAVTCLAEGRPLVIDSLPEESHRQLMRLVEIYVPEHHVSARIGRFAVITPESAP